MMRAFILLLLSSQAWSQNMLKGKDTEGLFLDMSKVNLGTITSEEDKKKYIYTIQLEKARITRKTLAGVYDNAFDLYRQGEFEAARELTQRILSIDPTFEDASILQRASGELQGSKRPRISEKKLVDDKFEEGMTLYRQGRLVEASNHWEEAVKLSPTNLKARYWLRKARGELAEEHFLRGQKAYRQHRLREALDQWYSALVLNPRYPKLSSAIAKVEAEAREQESNDKLQTALNLYSQGQADESLKVLDSVLETGPGNVKAQKLITEIRSELSSNHVSEGRRLYESRKYKEAMAEWKAAVAYGYDARAAEQLIARAKEQMRKEDIARREAAERAKEREEEAKRLAAERAAKEKADKEAREKAQKDGTPAVTATGQATGTTAASSGGPMAPTTAGGTAPTTGGQQTSATAPPATSQPTAPLPGAVVSEENKKSSMQHYLSGVVYFQKGDYSKARDEWSLAKQLDPGNADAQAGLERIEKIYSGGQ
jgi:tetratricopeptide (TPR) repeat protein